MMNKEEMEAIVKQIIESYKFPDFVRKVFPSALGIGNLDGQYLRDYQQDKDFYWAYIIGTNLNGPPEQRYRYAAGFTISKMADELSIRHEIESALIQFRLGITDAISDDFPGDPYALAEGGKIQEL